MKTGQNLALSSRDGTWILCCVLFIKTAFILTLPMRGRGDSELELSITGGSAYRESERFV